jgi:predicted nicotinamide N-methyase
VPFNSRSTFKASKIVELGAGVGLAGLISSKLPGTRTVILTDYDHGALELLRENANSNKAIGDGDISVEFLQWGKPLPSVLRFSTSSSHSTSSDGGIISEGVNCHSLAELLVIGSDLLYSADIVRPLLTTVKELISSFEGSKFVLVSSFDPGEVSEQS